ncbi:MAG: NAD(P)H-dependent oxidoreductase, partial [Cyclobacteriaceae bacterium]
LSGKIALNAITAGGTRKVYCADGSNNYTVSEFLRPFEQTAVLCGMEYLPPFAVLGTHRLDRQGILDHQAEYANLLESLRNGSLGPKARDNCQFLNDLTEIKNTKIK